MKSSVGYRRSWRLKIFLFLALAAILFTGAEPRVHTPNVFAEVTHELINLSYNHDVKSGLIVWFILEPSRYWPFTERID